MTIACLLFAISRAVAEVPAEARQLIVAIAPDWSARHATLQCYERREGYTPWVLAFSKSWQVNLGLKGLAWGRSPLTPANSKVQEKVEHDNKAPAGVFEMGPVYGYAPKPPRGTTWPYVQVGPSDAWIDDPKLPHYNQYVHLDPAQLPPWFEKQRMRLGDNAYRWMIEIRHNTDPPTPGYGSAIFFHVRRGPEVPTGGCTTMAVDDLEAMIRWLKPDKRPCYVLLPKDEYTRVREKWGLP